MERQDTAPALRDTLTREPQPWRGGRELDEQSKKTSVAADNLGAKLQNQRESKRVHMPVLFHDETSDM